MSVAVQITWDNRVELCMILGALLPKDSPLRHDGPRPEGFEVMVPTTYGVVKARSGEWLIFDNGAGVRDASFQVMIEKHPGLENRMRFIDRRVSAGIVNNEAKCEVHDEPLVQIHRCEVPANMNGAPRPVCPECLEERAERAESDVKDLRDIAAARGDRDSLPPRTPRPVEDPSVDGGVELLRYKKIIGDCVRRHCRDRDAYPCSEVGSCESAGLWEKVE